MVITAGSILALAYLVLLGFVEVGASHTAAKSNKATSNVEQVASRSIAGGDDKPLLSCRCEGILTTDSKRRR